MSAVLDYDTVLEHRRLREEHDAELREAAVDQAKAEIRVELLVAFKRAFAGEPVLIPYASCGNVIEQTLSEALSDVWCATGVETLFLESQAAPVEQMAAARAAFQSAAAIAYVRGQIDALAEHRVNNPGKYA